MRKSNPFTLNKIPVTIKWCAKLIVLFAIVMFLLSLPKATAKSQETVGIGASFAPGTPNEYVNQVMAQLHGGNKLHYNASSRWYPYSTALNSGGYSYGDGIRLTWSIMPDGTNMPGQIGEPACLSSFRADMDAAYGAGNWMDELETVFTEWAAVSGIEYVYEPQDDGAVWPTTPGIAGVRGDMRIGGCYIDGNSGILAYNFYPDWGDMKVDSPDIWFINNPLTTGFHNVTSHENGHGIGIQHVCPFEQTKLMEPWVSQTFVGPQLDDMRAVQRLYGDAYENLAVGNDTAVSASDLGAPPEKIAQQVHNVGLDSSLDQDWYQITVSDNRQIDIMLMPTGNVYEDSNQNQNGSCPPAGTGPFVDTARIQDLSFELLDSDGTTVLYTGNLNGPGEVESISAQALGGGGAKYLRVFGAGSDDVQLYDLDFTVQPIPGPEPQINVSPATFEETAVSGEQIVQSFNIGNTGTADLYWEIYESNNLLAQLRKTLPPGAIDAATAACDAPADISWITCPQTEGTVNPGNQSAVSLIFDTTDLTAGTYQATICIDSNDTTDQQMAIPITLSVEEPCVAPPETAVTLASSSNDIILTWPHEPANASYEVHRTALPYFEPDNNTLLTDPPLGSASIGYTDENVLLESGDRLFYRVRTTHCGGSADSKTTGYMEFPLVTGH